MPFKSRWILILIVFVLILSIYFSGTSSYISLSTVQANLVSWQAQTVENPMASAALFLMVYILSTAFSLPGATVLTLLGGALFGTLWGFFLVSIASCLGATLAFLGTRYLFRDWIESRFPDKLKVINQGVERDGVFYLLSLRLAPVVPFFLVNMLMGLTQLSVGKFFFVSQIGMIPGTLAYVFAGRQLAQIQSMNGLLSPGFISALLGLAVTPWIARSLMKRVNSFRLYRKFQRPKSYDYNLIVIGAGAGGLVSAYIAAAVKAKVAIVEKHKMGGDCLNYGCVPSKALIKSSKVAHLVHHAAKFGVTTSESKVDFGHIMSRLREVIREIEPHDSVERYQNLGVDCYAETAKILTPFEVQIGEKRFTTKAIVIATGATPIIPEIPGIEDIEALTSETLWSLKSLPQRLLILGGGAIGCELAQSFQRLGSQVTLIERAEAVMNRMDPEVSLLINERLTQEGVTIRSSTTVKEFKGSRALIEKEGQCEWIEFDQVFLALGRRARTEGFGLEDLGIQRNEQGFIEHDTYLATKYPNIYVCGDCAGPYQLTHAAAHQAWYASVNSLFSPLKRFQQDLRVIPSVTFTDPEVSHVGLTEKEALAQNIQVDVTRYDISDLDRAICDGEASGFIKILTAQGKDEILGATIVSSRSGEFLPEIVFAMKHRMGLTKILSTIHSYPTWAEANKYAAGKWKMENTSKAVLNFIERFHHWRRS